MPTTASAFSALLSYNYRYLSNKKNINQLYIFIQHIDTNTQSKWEPWHNTGDLHANVYKRKAPNILYAMFPRSLCCRRCQFFVIRQNKKKPMVTIEPCAAKGFFQPLTLRSRYRICLPACLPARLPPVLKITIIQYSTQQTQQDPCASRYLDMLELSSCCCSKVLTLLASALSTTAMSTHTIYIYSC